MRIFDVFVAALLVYPWLTQGLEANVPGLGRIELPDLGVPMLAGALVLTGVLELARSSWRPSGRFGLAVLGLLAMPLGVALTVMALSPWWHAQGAQVDFVYAAWLLTRGGGGVLVAALVGLAVHFWWREPWEASFFLRQAIRVGRAWQRALERSPQRTLWAAAIAVGAIYAWPSLIRHWALESHGFDLGIFTNVLWNLTHGNGYVSSLKGGINLFADHQSPLLWLFAPLFALAPYPETLLVAQGFGLAAGGPALFYLARRRFGAAHWAPAALPWLYWGYLPLRNANAFDFHPEVFMLPLFLWAFVGFTSERRRDQALGLLALAGALGAKESASVVAAGIGAAWALLRLHERRSIWPGVALAAAGVALFFFDVKVVPRLLGVEYAYMNMYERFGGGIGDLMLAPFTQPAYFLSQLINRERLLFLFWTLAPLGFLPLFEWRAALAVLPLYLMLFLSEGDQRVHIWFHYGIEPGTALFWALPFGLAAFARRAGWRFAGAWVFVWALAAHGTTELERARSYFQYLHADWLQTRVLPCLDPDLAVAASDSLTPHLATRAWISYPDRLEQSPAARPVECVVTDLGVDNWPLGRERTRRLLEELPDKGYREIWRCYDFRIHERADARCLRCKPQCY